MKVKIYRNLQKKTFSVVDQATGRVAFYADFFVVANARFKVQKAGRQRVLREGRKNVHAFVVGELREIIGKDREGGVVNTLKSSFLIHDEYKKVSYNPYKAATFTSNGQAVSEAQEVIGRTWFKRSDFEKTPLSAEIRAQGIK